MSDELSPEMDRAAEFARKHGGKLYRHPGGFWGSETWSGMNGKWFGTATVEALVKRGAATYSAYRGSFARN